MTAMHVFRAVRLAFTALVLSMLIPGQPATGHAAEPLVLAVHPYLSEPEVHARFSPLARYLETRTGRTVRIKVADTYDDHIRAVGEGEADIAYLGPVSYIALVDRYGPQVMLARQADAGRPTFRGVVMTRQDSGIKTLGDLKGKSFAFGAEESTMSHVVPEVMLYEAGVRRQDLSAVAFVGGHKQVALSVLTGKFDAGGVKEEVFKAYDGRGLKALAYSDPVSEHLFVAGKNTNPSLQKALKEALLASHTDEAGRAALTEIKGTLTGFVMVGDKNYDMLRRIMGAYSIIKEKAK